MLPFVLTDAPSSVTAFLYVRLFVVVATASSTPMEPALMSLSVVCVPVVAAVTVMPPPFAVSVAPVRDTSPVYVPLALSFVASVEPRKP